MAIQTINIGNLVNDGLGDDLRTAFEKVNANFTELQSYLTVTASNAAGTNGEGIFKEKVGSDLRFKNLIAGNKIVLESFTDSIKISSSQQDAFIRIDTDQGAVSASASPYITIEGSPNINVTASAESVIKVDTVVNFDKFVNGLDFSDMGEELNVFHLIAITSNIDFGTILNPSELAFDFGSI